MFATSWEQQFIQKLESLVVARGGVLPVTTSPTNWHRRSLALLDALANAPGGAAGADFPVSASASPYQMRVVTGAPLTFGVLSNQIYGLLSYQNPSAVNDELIWSVYLKAGNYTLSCLSVRNSNYGIASAYVGQALQGTMDAYAPSITYNVLFTVPLVIPSSGLHNIRLRVEGRNASSTGFFFIYTHLWIG